MSLGDFSQQADAYAKSRPSYPATLLDELLRDADVPEGSPVADIGAGTGIFSRLLAERGLVVSAVEPNSAMRLKAGRWPFVTRRDGTFEATGLQPASQRWVVAAQAFHWADPPRALPEMRRILQPGCGFTVLWNNRLNEANEILAWTQHAIQRHIPDFDEAYRDRAWGDVLLSTGDFTRVVAREERHAIPMPRERFLSLWRSHNRLNAIAGPERFAAFFGELERRLDAERIEEVEVPYRCQAWTAF